MPAEVLRAGIDRYLIARAGGSEPVAQPETTPPLSTPEAFVSEDDVRRAAREGRRLLLGPRTIVTPAARDAGTAARSLRLSGRNTAITLS